MQKLINTYNQSKYYRYLILLALSIPIINVIATIAVGHITGGIINPGTLRAIIIYLMFIYIFNKGLPSNRLVLPTYLSIIALFFSTLLSSDFTTSFYIYLRFVITSMLFIVGYYAVKTTHILARLNRVIVFVLAIQLIYIVLANVFKFGTSDYLEGSFYFGETGVNITKEMVIAVFIAPIFFILEKNKRVKIFAALLFIASLVIILIGLKRAALLSVGAGVLVYFWFSPRKFKSIRIIVFGFLFMALLSPYFITLVQERYEARSKKVSMSYEELDEDEGRVQEIEIVWQNFLEKNTFGKLFGSNPFLSKQDYFGINRIIHVDYLSLLDGGGVVGLLLYMWVYFAIFMHILMYSSAIKQTEFWGELKTVGITLIVIQLIMGLAGTIIGIGLRGLSLMYLGAICGVLHRQYLVQKAQNT